MLIRRIRHVPLAVAAVLLACGREAPRAVIGLADDTTAMPLAREAIRSSYKPGDPPIDIISQPPPGRLVKAVTIARRFTEVSHAVVEVGPPGSGNGLLTAPIFGDAHIVQLLTTATDPQIRSSGAWTFMLAPDDTAEARFLAGFVWRRFAPAAVSIFYVRDAYGVDLSRGIASALSAEGATVNRTPVRTLTYAECLAGDRANVLAGDVQASLARLRPNVVVLATRIPEAGCLVDALRRARIRGAIVIGDGAPLSELASRYRFSMDSVYGVDFWTPSAGRVMDAAFLARFEKRYHRSPTASEALTYDALMLAATAIRTAGVDPRDVREYLQSLGHERPPYPGVTGAITFPASAQRLVLVQIARDGHVARITADSR